MDHRPAEQLAWEAAPPEWFTGQVWFGPMAPPAEADDLNVLGVLFAPGARTDWHTHPGGQVLHVVSGAGRVQTEAGETIAVGPGDTVVTPPGELHWHGAAPGSYLMHLSITHRGATQWVGRKVSDDDYEAQPG